MSSNFIKNIAIVGATGNSGSFMTTSLLRTGRHTITALTRDVSLGARAFPPAVRVKTISYADPGSIVSALRGQDALIITMAPMAQSNIEALIRAAAEAEVPWVMPNDWGIGEGTPDLIRDVPAFAGPGQQRKLIRELGVSSFVSLGTGFWYEWSLAIESGFGFDILKREATLFDEGEIKTSISTWPQVGRAVAALMSLPIKKTAAAADDDKTTCLEDFRNKVVHVNSFTVNQKEMLASLLRVTGTKEEDWTIKKEGSRERYEKGKQDFAKGEIIGFQRMMYSRVFFPDAPGNFEHARGTDNEALGLEKEKIDEATKRAIERAEMLARERSV